MAQMGEVRKSEGALANPQKSSGASGSWEEPIIEVVISSGKKLKIPRKLKMPGVLPSQAEEKRRQGVLEQQAAKYPTASELGGKTGEATVKSAPGIELPFGVTLPGVSMLTSPLQTAKTVARDLLAIPETLLHPVDTLQAMGMTVPGYGAGPQQEASEKRVGELMNQLGTGSMGAGDYGELTARSLLNLVPGGSMFMGMGEESLANPEASLGHALAMGLTPPIAKAVKPIAKAVLPVPKLTAGMPVGAAAAEIARTARNINPRNAVTAVREGAGMARDLVSDTVRGQNPVKHLSRALKPTRNDPWFQEQAPVAMSRLAEASERLGKPLNKRGNATLENLIDSNDEAIGHLTKEMERLRGTDRELPMVDGTPVADAIVANIPKHVKVRSPRVFDAISKWAYDTYARTFDEAELHELAADIEASPTVMAWAEKAPALQSQLLRRKQPAIMVAEAKTLRKLQADLLDREIKTGGDLGLAADELKTQYRFRELMERRISEVLRGNEQNFADSGFKTLAAWRLMRVGHHLYKGKVKLAFDDLVSAGGEAAIGKMLRNYNSFDNRLGAAFRQWTDRPAPFAELPPIPATKPPQGAAPVAQAPVAQAPVAPAALSMMAKIKEGLAGGKKAEPAKLQGDWHTELDGDTFTVFDENGLAIGKGKTKKEALTAAKERALSQIPGKARREVDAALQKEVNSLLDENPLDSFEQPVAQAPVAQAPVAQAPVAQVPVAQAPAIITPEAIKAKYALPKPIAPEAPLSIEAQIRNRFADTPNIPKAAAKLGITPEQIVALDNIMKGEGGGAWTKAEVAAQLKKDLGLSDKQVETLQGKWTKVWENALKPSESRAIDPLKAALQRPVVKVTSATGKPKVDKSFAQYYRENKFASRKEARLAYEKEYAEQIAARKKAVGLEPEEAPAAKAVKPEAPDWLEWAPNNSRVAVNGWPTPKEEIRLRAKYKEQFGIDPVGEGKGRTFSPEDIADLKTDLGGTALGDADLQRLMKKEAPKPTEPKATGLQAPKVKGVDTSFEAFAKKQGYNLRKKADRELAWEDFGDSYGDELAADKPASQALRKWIDTYSERGAVSLEAFRRKASKKDLENAGISEIVPLSKLKPGFGSGLISTRGDFASTVDHARAATFIDNLRNSVFKRLDNIDYAKSPDEWAEAQQAAFDTSHEVLGKVLYEGFIRVAEDHDGLSINTGSGRKPPSARQIEALTKLLDTKNPDFKVYWDFDSEPAISGTGSPAEFFEALYDAYPELNKRRGEKGAASAEFLAGLPTVEALFEYLRKESDDIMGDISRSPKDKVDKIGQMLLGREANPAEIANILALSKVVREMQGLNKDLDSEEAFNAARGATPEEWEKLMKEQPQMANTIMQFLDTESAMDDFVGLADITDVDIPAELRAKLDDMVSRYDSDMLKDPRLLDELEMELEALGLEELDGKLHDAAADYLEIELGKKPKGKDIPQEVLDKFGYTKEIEAFFKERLNKGVVWMDILSEMEEGGFKAVDAQRLMDIYRSKAEGPDLGVSSGDTSFLSESPKARDLADIESISMRTDDIIDSGNPILDGVMRIKKWLGEAIEDSNEKTRKYYSSKAKQQEFIIQHIERFLDDEISPDEFEAFAMELNPKLKKGDLNNLSENSRAKIESDMINHMRGLIEKPESPDQPKGFKASDLAKEMPNEMPAIPDWLLEDSDFNAMLDVDAADSKLVDRITGRMTRRQKQEILDSNPDLAFKLEQYDLDKTVAAVLKALIEGGA